MTLLLALIACGPADVPRAEGGDAPTWHQDVAPLFAERCGACHAAGGAAPFALDTWEDAAALSGAALAAVESGEMPPFDAYETDGCASSLPWKDDPRLSDEEIALLRAWVEAGAPEGDAGAAAPLPAVAPRGLDVVDRELTAGSGWIAAGASDQFMCFSLDPETDQPTWVTGVEFEPGNPAVNHHAVVFTDPAGESAAWGGEYVGCFGTPSISDSQPLAVWTPGADPMELPDGAGFPLAAGARLVVQVHYHPAGPAAAPDQSTVRLRLAQDPPEHQAFLAGVGNFGTAADGLLPGPADPRGEPEFRIPSGSRSHVETMRLVLGETPEFRILSVMPHEHYIGTDMQIRWDHAPGAAEPDECVAARWRFDWQRSYTWDAPIDELPVGRPGDTITVRCQYDNSLDNPWVSQALADAGLDAPIDVYLGEGTLDEMCLGIFVLLL